MQSRNAIFLLDGLLDALMITLALQLQGRKARLRSVLAGGVTGALCAQGIALLPLSRGQAAFLWLPTALLMMLAADFERTARRPVRSTLVLLASAGLIGGILQALYGALGSLGIAYALGLAFVPVIACGAVRARRVSGDAVRAELIVRYREKTARFEAIIDSGNGLRDYLTHCPVIVLPEEIGRRRLALGDAPLRPIFANTAGGRQMMDCLTPETTEVLFCGSRKRVRAVIALSPGLAPDAPGLIPLSLVEAGGQSD